MAKVCITDAVPEAGLDELRAAGHEIRSWTGEQPATHARRVARPGQRRRRRAERAHRRGGPEFLDAAGPQLKVVANIAAGFNNIDLELCKQRGISHDDPGVLFDSTADTAFARC